MVANAEELRMNPASETPSRRRKPGPRPGTRHAGMFKSGPDPRRHTLGPNPSEVKRSFQEKIQELSHDAIQVLAEVLADRDAPYKERRAAAELVISHGYGTPVNRVAIAQVHGSGTGQVQTMNLPALRQRAAALLDHVDGDVIDGELASNGETLRDSESYAIVK